MAPSPYKAGTGLLFSIAVFILMKLKAIIQITKLKFKSFLKNKKLYYPVIAFNSSESGTS